MGGVSTPESLRRGPPAPGCSEHPHLGLGTKHPLLIGSQDQCLLASHVVRLGGDVAIAIEEEHSQELTGSPEEMHRDEADRAERLRGVAAMAAPG